VIRFYQRPPDHPSRILHTFVCHRWQMADDLGGKMMTAVWVGDFMPPVFSISNSTVGLNCRDGTDMARPNVSVILRLFVHDVVGSVKARRRGCLATTEQVRELIRAGI
jgi:hypothetical protein